jgi:ferric-dicitrate binding protein FerR (iron transport regulator)
MERMMEEENYMDILIAGFLAGETTPEQNQELNKWLETSEQNRKYFENHKLIFSTSSRLKNWREFDANKAWRKLHIDSKADGRAIPLRRNSTTWLAVAASIAAIATFGYLLLDQQNVTLEPVLWSTNTLTEVKRDTLPDGTLAFLNKETEIAFAYNETEKLKTVALLGEAYFEIENEKEERFQIEIDELIIEDIGTSFNVNAYPKSELITVIVEKGEVALYTLNDPGIRVLAGETGIFNKTTKSFAKISEADPNALAYKTRYFSFNNTLLSNIVASMEEVYDVKILLENEMLRNCRITVTFRDEEIDTIMDIIAATLELEVRKINTTEFELHGNGCVE